MWCQFAVIPFLLIYLCFKKTEGNSLISQLPGNPALGASFFFSRSSSSSSSSSLNLVGSLIFCCWLGDNMNVHTRNRITLMGLGTARSGLTTQKSRSCCDLSHPKNWNLKIQSIEKENHLVKTSIFEFHVNFQGYNDCIMIPIIHISSWSHGETVATTHFDFLPQSNCDSQTSGTNPYPLPDRSFSTIFGDESLHAKLPSPKNP